MPVPRPPKVTLPNQRRRPLPPLDPNLSPNMHANARQRWGRVRNQIRFVMMFATASTLAVFDLFNNYLGKTVITTVTTC